jgi:hypothetical protein
MVAVSFSTNFAKENFMAIRYLAAMLVLVVAGCSQSAGNPGSNTTAGAGGQSSSSAAGSVDQAAVTNANLVTFNVPKMH